MQRNLVIVIIVLLALIACSKEGHIEIEIKDLRLEQLPAGSWLKVFEISYEQGADEPKRQILRKLRAAGHLTDKVVNESNGNVVTTLVWKYRGLTVKEQYYQGGFWRGPKVIPHQEYSQGELAVWITVEFSRGIPYSTLLPNYYQRINPDRKYEHTATIKTRQARLFLFGFGSHCQRISLY